ncbi:MAG: hypothetical protein LBT12_04245 [Oscillospiraceae bacterium]|jgi:hypothetical protein|nr:hypothetical protein [Oscillospiraceae bacterium]
MKVKIPDILDCIQDDSAKPRGAPGVSNARVRKLTLAKIAAYEEKSSAKPNFTAPRKKTALRRAGLLAAAIAAALIVSGAALAAAGVLDLRTFYNAIFENPEAADFVVPGDEVPPAAPPAPADEAPDMEIELLGAYTEGGRAILRFALRDLIGGRLGGRIYIDFGAGDMESGFAEVEYGAADTAIASIRHAAGEAPVQTRRVARILTGAEYVMAEPLDFDLAAHLGMTEPVALGGGAVAEITAVTLQDGILAISHRPTGDPLEEFGLHGITLQRPDGELIAPYYGRGGDDNTTTRFYEIGGLDPGELTPVWSGLRAANVIEVDRTFTFDASKRIEPRAISAELDGRAMALELGATKLTFTLYPGYELDWDGAEELGNSVKLTLRDGTEAFPKINGGMWDDDSAYFGFDVAFTLPEDVVSVTINGQVFAFAE